MTATTVRLGTPEVAKRLGATVPQVRRLVRSGALKSRRVGNRLVFSDAELARYAARNQVGRKGSKTATGRRLGGTKRTPSAGRNGQLVSPELPSLTEQSARHVQALLNRQSTAERSKAMAELAVAADKDAVALRLGRDLAAESDQWRRCWMVSALGAIGRVDTASVVVAHLQPGRERSAWVRYWAAIAVARLRPPDWVGHLKRATRDRDPLVRAVACRLLLGQGKGEDFLDRLVHMIRQPDDWDARWAACKVFRRESALGPLDEPAETRIIPVLIERLRDKRESMDTHYQAALALGNMTHGWRAAQEALSDALSRPSPDWIRRACVDALGQLGRPESKEPLLRALSDEDAEIRVRAAVALQKVLGPDPAVDYIVEALLQSEVPRPDFVVALRHIDEREAARALSSKLLDSRREVAERASRALVQLGGEEAVRTLQAQRAKAMETYTRLLGDADEKIMDQFRALMSQARRAFQVSMWMHGSIFFLGAVVLAVSLWMLVGQGSEVFERFIGAGGAVGSLGTLLLLFYKDPVKNISHSVTNLVKVNVVFSGYVRQINQIDATFKQLFLAAAGFGLSEMKETVELIQTSVKETMEEVKAYLSEK